MAPAGVSWAAEALSLVDCARIADGERRLICYDDVVGRSTRPAPDAPTSVQPALPPLPALVAPESPAAPQQETDPALAQLPPPDLPATLGMAQHWELGAENQRGTFGFRPHHSNYLLLTHSSSPNSAPYRPFRTADTDGELSHTELAFQLGFKTKLIEGILNRPLDLWFGYTQQSFWQASNHRASSPFRETNYQPELMLVTPANFRVLGMNARFLNLGFAHQSNGQASSLSRSWNRVYAQLGLERGDFSLLARVWKRIDEDRSEDDNPDINDYMGYGDLQAAYRWHGHEFSALTRYNLRKGHGAMQLGWAFPLSANLKGYLQVFSGYGQSLIEYDHAQQTIGLGVMLNY